VRSEWHGFLDDDRVERPLLWVAGAAVGALWVRVLRSMFFAPIRSEQCLGIGGPCGEVARAEPMWFGITVVGFALAMALAAWRLGWVARQLAYGSVASLPVSMVWLLS
jgi:hypothetical protein